MSSLTRDEVARLAGLARIALSDEELDDMSDRLSVIVDAVAKVSSVASDDVPATSHPLPISNVMRTDEVVPGLSTDEALSGAPAQESDRFVVPQILGEEP